MSRPCRSSPWAALGSGAAAYGVIQIKLKQRLLPDTDLLESYCAEHEKDSYHLEGKQVFFRPARFSCSVLANDNHDIAQGSRRLDALLAQSGFYSDGSLNATYSPLYPCPLMATTIYCFPFTK